MLICNTLATPAISTRNRHQINDNHQSEGKIGFRSVLIRFFRFRVGMYSNSKLYRGELFQAYLKDLSPTNCRLFVGYMSVMCRLRPVVPARVDIDTIVVQTMDFRHFMGDIQLLLKKNVLGPCGQDVQFAWSPPPFLSWRPRDVFSLCVCVCMCVCVEGGGGCWQWSYPTINLVLRGKAFHRVV